MKAAKTKEILAITQNRVGMLMELSQAIAKKGANITAICASGMGDKARFVVVTSDNAKAKEALKAKAYEVKEEDVVEVSLENKVGALEEMSKKLADANIDLNYIYGTVGDGKAPATIIFSSNNNDKALEVLK